MAKRRGLSLEDKRKGMMEIFYESKDFFQLKELEKIAPKEKGIVQGSVKDVVQSLVDDGMIDTDKIGTSIYFWAFPSKAANTKKQKLAQLENRSEELMKLRRDIETKLTKLNVISSWNHLLWAINAHNLLLLFETRQTKKMNMIENYLWISLK